MAEPAVSTTILGGTQSGIIGAATVTAAQIIINNYPPIGAELAAIGGAIGPCPYPGLAYFGPNDADRFFGRDETIAKLVTAIGRQSLTALVGASGSGKSSVVLAGLAPRLHRGGRWLFSYFRLGNEPDRHPFLALARALVPFYVTSSDETERLINTKKLAEKLRSGDLTLRDVFADCRGRNRGTSILLIADQFEEAFTLVQDDADRNRFIDVLLAGFPDPVPGNGSDICLILTLRADFYGRALLHRPLVDALQGRVENLGPMNRQELQSAILRPAENMEISFDPSLVETLLDDVESKPGSLPLLQFALREMWGRQENRRITRKSYDDIGGVEGALAQRAEAIFATMTDNGANSQMARAFQRLFTRLVMLGEGQEDTRRVVDRRELGEEAWALAQRLAGEDNRIVVTNAAAVTSAQATSEIVPKETAEIVHEALIRNWPTMMNWISQDRAFLSWLRQLKPRLDEWHRNPDDEGTLLRGGPLAVSEEWLDQYADQFNDEEKDYVEAGIALREATRHKEEEIREAESRRYKELTEEIEARFRDAEETKKIEEAVRSETTKIAQRITDQIHEFHREMSDLQYESWKNGYFSKKQDVFRKIDHMVSEAIALSHQLELSQHQQKWETEVTDLNQIIASMSDRMRSVIGPTNRIEIALADNVWSVVGNRRQIELVLLDLLLNAREAMPNGGMIRLYTANVTLHLADTPFADLENDAKLDWMDSTGVLVGDYVMISITDTGTAPQPRWRVFDRFGATKDENRGLRRAGNTVAEARGGICIGLYLGSGRIVRVYLPTVETYNELPIKARVRAPLLSRP
jgi:signal transduction histidine kinase